jgi:hypothetical protein
VAYLSHGLPNIPGTDAHSGATVAAFNRIPVSISQSKLLQDLQLYYFFFKEQTTNHLSGSTAAFK